MEHKKQHWVPESYLREWCDPDVPEGQDDYVWIFSVDGSNVRRKAPKNIFYESDMYTTRSQDGTRVLKIEDGLSGLESSFSNVRKNILLKHKKLKTEDRMIILRFIAAAFSRTRGMRDHSKEQWNKLHDLGLEMKKEIENASPERRKVMASIGKLSSGEKGLSLGEVKRLAEQPLQKTLIPSILIQTELFLPMNLSFLSTENDPGFITSDSPCVWFDPMAYKRPAFYRSPGLAYKTIKISLPISPNLMALLTWQPSELYIDVNDDIVDDFNRRTRFFAQEYFVVKRNYTKAIWFDPGKPPKGWSE